MWRRLGPIWSLLKMSSTEFWLKQQFGFWPDLDSNARQQRLLTQNSFFDSCNVSWRKMNNIFYTVYQLLIFQSIAIVRELLRHLELLVFDYYNRYFKDEMISALVVNSTKVTIVISFIEPNRKMTPKKCNWLCCKTRSLVRSERSELEPGLVPSLETPQKRLAQIISEPLWLFLVSPRFAEIAKLDILSEMSLTTATKLALFVKSD